MAFVKGIHLWPVYSSHSKEPVSARNVENISIWWRHHVGM